MLALHRHNPAVFLVIFGGIFAALCIFSVQSRSITTDEPSHFDYGLRLLDGNPNRIKEFDDSKMPFSALNALPTKIARWIPDGWLKSFLNEFNTARYMTVFFSVGIAILIFYWSYSLYGMIPALVSLLLYTFDPNIIAHSQLVTTDIYAMGTIALVFYFLWRFAHQRTLRNGILCASALGLSQLAKYTSIVLLPLCLLTLLIYDTPGIFKSLRDGRVHVIGQYLIHSFIYIGTALISIVLFTNVGFLFDRSFVRLRDYRFRSDLLQALQRSHSKLNALPVPTPYSYLDGLDWVIYREKTNQGFGNIYLLGAIRNGRGFAGYFFVSSLLKTPIASQIILWVAFIIYLHDKNRRHRFFSNELFLFIPILFFSIYFNFFYRAQIGIRHFLVVFPFLYVFTGSLFIDWLKRSSFQKGTSIALGIYLVVSVLSYYPYYLSYFNEIVWDKTQTYKYLADSNIDWKQSMNEYYLYLAQHPEAVTDLERPAPAHLIININKLVGVVGLPEKYAWLRENFEPVDTVAYNLLVYKLTEKQIQSMCERSPDFCK